MKKIIVLGPAWRNDSLCRSIRTRGHACDLLTDHTALSERKFDVLLSSGYDKRIPDSIIYREGSRAFNAHSSYLPYGRGIGTQLFSLIFPVTLGCSIHVLESEFDSGDIVAREKFDLANLKGMTQREYYMYSLNQTENLVLDNLDRLLSADTSSFIKNEWASEIPYFTRSDCEFIYSLLPNGWDSSLEECLELQRYMAFNFACLAFEGDCGES